MKSILPFKELLNDWSKINKHSHHNEQYYREYSNNYWSWDSFFSFPLMWDDFNAGRMTILQFIA